MDTLIKAVVLFVISITGWTTPDQTIKVIIDEKQVFLNSGRDAAYQGDGVILVRELPATLTPEFVHEVVHHFQYAQGRMHKDNTSREECMLEVEAERIENVFRRRAGMVESDFYEKLCEPAFRETKNHQKKEEKE